MLRRQPDREYRVIGPEYLGQHPLGEPSRQRPLVDTLILRQFLAFVQRDGHSVIGLHEQVVLSENSGKEHPVPMLVGTFVHQTINGLISGTRVAAVAQLADVGAQAPAQLPLLRAHVRVRFAMMNGERLQRRPRPVLRRIAGGGNRSLKLLAECR